MNKEKTDFEKRLTELITVSDWDGEFARVMGWWNEEKQKVRGTMRGYALKRPEAWSKDLADRLINFLNSKGQDGLIVFMELVDKFGLGLKKITWGQGIAYEARAGKAPLAE